jgi:hypothetical protein
MLDHLTPIVVRKANTALLTKALAPFIQPEIKKAEDDITNKENYVKGYQNDINQCDDYIIEFHQKIEYTERKKIEYTQQLGEYTTRLDAARKAAKAIKLDKERMKKTLERLKKHKAVHHIQVEGNVVEVYLNPLFVNIRLNADTKKTKRRFIGCMKVKISHNTDRFVVTNLSFPYRNPFWSCNSDGKPCFGSWKQVPDLLQSGDIRMLMDILVSYLTSTEDSAAYMRSDSWIDHRNNQIETTSELEIGGSYIFIGGPQEDIHSYDMEHATGERNNLIGQVTTLTGLDRGNSYPLLTNFWVRDVFWKIRKPESLLKITNDEAIYLRDSTATLDLSSAYNFIKSWTAERMTYKAPSDSKKQQLLDWLDELTQEEANAKYPLLAQQIKL